MAATAEFNLTLDPMRNSHNNLLVWNQRSEMPYINLEGDHPRIISAKFG
jgi:hypothetical protein